MTDGVIALWESRETWPCEKNRNLTRIRVSHLVVMLKTMALVIGTCALIGMNIAWPWKGPMCVCVCVRDICSRRMTITSEVLSVFPHEVMRWRCSRIRIDGASICWECRMPLNVGDSWEAMCWIRLSCWSMCVLCMKKGLVVKMFDMLNGF